MKTRARFIYSYSFGTFLTFSVVALVISLLIYICDSVMPLNDMPELFAALIVIAACLLPVLIGGGLWGIWFAEPVFSLMSLLRGLSGGDYDISEQISTLYTKGNTRKLKARYRLYEEVLTDFLRLAAFLNETERSRVAREESKKNWIAGVSHDLKTPLSYITGCAELLLKKEYDFEPQEQTLFLQSIYDKGVTIGELITDLNLSFKMDEVNAEFPLSKTEFELIDFMRRQIADIINDPRADGYELSLQSGAEQIKISADRRLLQRAFQNIIMNGVLHNPTGTCIEITVDKEPSGGIRINVKDNGLGMDESTVKNLFSRYYRNPAKDDTNFSGGLGLSVAQKIIEAHGGAVHVSSVQSQGTLFTINL